MTNLIIGLLCLALGAWGLVAWWEDFGQALRGAVPLLLILLGLAAIGAGMAKKTSGLPEGARENPDEAGADTPVRRAE
jgi:hypothetical protein